MRFEAVARLKPSKAGWESLVHVLRSEGARGCWGTAGCFICEGGGFGERRAQTGPDSDPPQEGLGLGQGGKGVALGGVGYGNYSMDLYFCVRCWPRNFRQSATNLRRGLPLCEWSKNRFESLLHPLRHGSPLGVSSELGNDPSAAQRPNAPASRSPRVQTRSFER